MSSHTQSVQNNKFAKYCLCCETLFSTSWYYYVWWSSSGMPKVLKITSIQFLWNISRQKSLKSRVRWSSLTYIYHHDFHMLLDYHFMLLYWWFGGANYLLLVLLFTSWLKWRKKVRTPFWGFGKLLKKERWQGTQRHIQNPVKHIRQSIHEWTK